jgi:hypothetical protein
MQKTFETAGPPRLDIRVPSGEVLIEPGREGVTEVELIGHDDASRQAVEEARVELTDNGQRVVIDVNPRSGSFFGLVLGRGGDIRFERVGRGVSAQSASGDVHVGAMGEGGAIQTVSGDAFVGTAGASLSLTTVSGDIRVDAVHEGNINLGAVSGDVVVGVRRGSRLWVDAQSISGETESELELAGTPISDEGPLVELRAKTVSGDIRVVRAPAPIHEEVHQ